LVILTVLAGSRLARLGDQIAERSGLGRVWVGLILLSAVTSIPELFSSGTAAFLGNADVATADILGSNMFNMVIFVLVDFFVIGSILKSIHPNQVFTALITMCLTAGIVLAIIAPISLPALLPRGYSLWPVGIMGMTLLVVYGFGMAFAHRLERRESPSSLKPDLKKPLKKILFLFGLFSFVMILISIRLGQVADGLTHIPTTLGSLTLHLSGGLVGGVFLAFATSLPEIVVSIGAARLGAADLSGGNLFGSNLFNLAILGVCDVLYTKGPILTHTHPALIWTGIFSLLMTGVAAAGVLYKSKKTFFRAGWGTWVLAGLYLLGLVGMSLLGISR